jgi:hypothetical protein
MCCIGRTQRPLDPIPGARSRVQGKESRQGSQAPRVGYRVERADLIGGRESRGAGVAGAGGRGGAQGDPGAGRDGVAAACGRIEEAAENRSQGGAGGEAGEAAGLPWSGVAENRRGVHRVGSGNLLPIVKATHGGTPLSPLSCSAGFGLDSAE